MNADWGMYFTVIITCLFAISEALAVIPVVQSNSVFQLIVNILKTLLGKK